MPEDQRTRLTKESIHSELLRTSGRHMLVFTIVWAITLLNVFLVAKQLFLDIASGWRWVILVLLVVGWVGESLYFSVPAVFEWWLLMTKRYRIEEDTVVDIRVEETLRRRGIERHFRNSRYKYESSVHFGRYGRVVTTKRVCEHSAVGDVFYLVVLDDRKHSVARIYNKKYFQLEE
jgi:hypothetical protein